MKKFSKRVESLLEAAFQMLQHDTNSTNPEYVHQWNHLGEEFTKILKKKEES